MSKRDHKCFLAFTWTADYLQCHVGRHPHLVADRRRQSAEGEELLPLVYDKLLKLAAVKLAQEKPGQTLQTIALFHETLYAIERS